MSRQLKWWLSAETPELPGHGRLVIIDCTADPDIGKWFIHQLADGRAYPVGTANSPEEAKRKAQQYFDKVLEDEDAD